MNRRDFLVSTILAGSGSAAFPLMASFSMMEDDGTTRITVHPDQVLGSIAPDFTGLGYEISSVARPGLLSATNEVYVQLVRNLSRQGVIRIGGNTADYASYSPTAGAESAPKATVVNDEALRQLGTFLDATGWRLIWGLDLGKGSVAEAVAEAKAVRRAAGSQLLAFEIGNEPDLFTHEKHRPPIYGYEDWLAEYRRYKTALRAELPGIPLAGPDVAVKTDWVTRFAADEGKDIVLLTHHYYREGQNPNSTIQKLLGPDPKLQPQLETLRAASRNCGVPYRICEVNSFSGGGRPGVSDTMAAALWVLDYMFTLATYECSGVNMETGVNQLDFISSYSPIANDESGHPTAKPEYYGMLAFQLAGKGELLGTETDRSSPEIKAYATRGTGGALTLTVVNKSGHPVSPTVTVTGPPRSWHASVVRLAAPGIEATAYVTLGGAEVTSFGTRKVQKPEMVAVSGGRFRLRVPAASAAIVAIV
jgi:Glycosyl hydrolase family 79 C-terminal beta domain